FTFSQASMVRRWWVLREAGWRRSFVINGVGAVTTGVVATVVAVSKFEHGAWMVFIIIPVLVLLLFGINRHYRRVADSMTPILPDEPLPTPRTPVVVVPVESLHLGTLNALSYARSISPNVVALMVTDSMETARELQRRWERWQGEIPLVIIESPYRSLLAPLLIYLDGAQSKSPGTPITVILPEFVPNHWWEFLLHNQSALRIKLALFFRPNTVVIDVPYHLQR
ncbi:MAG: amino acid permease, partial [Dehalococcoidia bacterium]|nr:amino acid permease [Dehalococcoidia bacterium]